MRSDFSLKNKNERHGKPGNLFSLDLGSIGWVSMKEIYKYSWGCGTVHTCVCVCVCVFIKLHITTQSGPVILVILCHSH